MMRRTGTGMRTVRPVSSETVRKDPRVADALACSAFTRLLEKSAAQKRKPIATVRRRCVGMRYLKLTKALQNEPIPCLRQDTNKNGPRVSGHRRNSLSRGVSRTAAWEGSLAYGLQPVTGGGGRGERTAFPAALACKL